MNEAELVLTHILDCNRASLYQRRAQGLDRETCARISSVLKRRALAEPLAYILGKADFMGFEFLVTADALIPRQETEILVETVMRYVSNLQPPASGLQALDIGTGSGCIAVSLAKLLTDAHITATDISEEALSLARRNAKFHDVGHIVHFVQSDLFNSDELRAKPYDLIISNPPYVRSDDIATLQPEVRHEPRIALDGGADGLDFYRRIVRQAPAYLRQGGFLMLEIGFDQKEEIKNIFKNAHNFEIIEFVRDYNRFERVVVAKRIG